MTGRALWQPLAALLFPERCPLCDEICVGGGVCGACREEAVHSPSLRSLGDGDLLCLAPYGDEGKLRDAILRFKFEGRRDYEPFFAEQIAREIRAQGLEVQGAVLTPVPMSRRKKRERGYNQSQLLAREVGRLLGIPCAELLEKAGENQVQHFLTAEERKRNVKGVYAMKKGIDRAEFILLDDIVTTGSTLLECAGTLRQASSGLVQVRFCAALASDAKSGGCKAESGIL